MGMGRYLNEIYKKKNSGNSPTNASVWGPFNITKSREKSSQTSISVLDYRKKKQSSGLLYEDYLNTLCLIKLQIIDVYAKSFSFKVNQTMKSLSR
uniref:Uncharacterized protein n=1 Tax=Lepeophtheirus salmonis TaxID=72036 RepID=A0A0K2SVU6_LEPSM